MKPKAILAALVLVVVSAFVPVLAETEAEQPAKVQELREKFAKERAEIAAQILEKRAELVRLSAQEDVDVEKVQKLVQEIAELRTNFQKKCEVYRETLGVIGRGAGIGLARMGLGAGPVGPRRGYGAGPRQGWGAAPRRGLGFGRGAAPGTGPGRAQVPGRFGPMPGRGPGRGFGPGAGIGRGWGMGPLGRGPFYVDKDKDGVCDYWEGAVKPPAPPAGAQEVRHETK